MDAKLCWLLSLLGAGTSKTKVLNIMRQREKERQTNISKEPANAQHQRRRAKMQVADSHSCRAFWGSSGAFNKGCPAMANASKDAVPCAIFFALGLFMAV